MKKISNKNIKVHKWNEVLVIQFQKMWKCARGVCSKGNDNHVHSWEKITVLQVEFRYMTDSHEPVRKPNYTVFPSAPEGVIAILPFSKCHGKCRNVKFKVVFILNIIAATF